MLDVVFLDLETTGGSAAHDRIIDIALSRLRLRPWPYAGPVGVRERDWRTGESGVHVFDRWRHVGTARSESDPQELLSHKPADFDAALYALIANRLARGWTRDIVSLCSRAS